MSDHRDRVYRVLHRVAERLVAAEKRSLVGKSAPELLTHFGIKLPVACPPTDECPQCHNDSYVFIRALGGKMCMACGYATNVSAHVGESAPPWDPFAPRHRARQYSEDHGVYVAEPVAGEVKQLRQGQRIEAHKIDIGKDIEGQIGGE
jgi:hypothetical protein